MHVQVLLSIMNEKNIEKKIKDMNISGNYVVINQITEDKLKLTNLNKNNNVILSLKDRGLSKSRNLAIKNSSANIGLISDDDMLYVDNYEQIITDAYLKYPDADIIAFIVEHENKKFEKSPFKEGKLNFIKSLRISSVQMTINLDSIKKKNVSFDENFGSGSKYFMGEENIFISDCFKKKMKIYYIPQKIGTLRVINESRWFKGYNKDFFIVKGAVFYRMSKIFYHLLILQFAIRKKKLYQKEMTLMQALKAMFKGVKKYKKEHK